MIGIVFADESEAKTVFKKVTNRKETKGIFVSRMFLTSH